jgi:hypothetical protein
MADLEITDGALGVVKNGSFIGHGREIALRGK